MKKAELATAVCDWQATQSTNDGLKRWALTGVVLMAVLSALLNGYANAQHASVEWAGWGMGLVIPVVVLVIFKVAGLIYKRGHQRAAFGMGVIGCGLLFLSVWHCSTSIALLTGGGIELAIPMAIAIDCGLVGCECAALID
tara:strand:+ start:90 stop:512 length:423 start_codon:yes stop_codon:yes gene_type:complete